MKSFIIICLSVAVSFVAGQQTTEDNDYEVHVSGPSLDNVTMPCTNDQQCKEKFKDALCFKNLCLCRESPTSDKDSYFCTLDKADLTPKKIGVIGRICKRDSECGFDNSYCNLTRFQCYCKSGFIGDTEGHKCLEVVKNINGTCEDSKQCLFTFANSTCKDKQCSCLTGFHFQDTKCLKDSVFGAACVDKSECYFGPYTHPETVDCINGHCNCTSGMYFYENICTGAGLLMHFSAAIIILLATSVIICS